MLSSSGLAIAGVRPEIAGVDHQFASFFHSRLLLLFFWHACLSHMLSLYMLFTGGSRPKRSRYVDPSLGRRQEQQDARVSIAVKKKRLEERKKKALFANIADLKKLSKQEYREFRE
jgi:hypothetical protein